MVAQVADNRSVDEVATAIQSLSTADLARLRLIAKGYAKLARMDPTDLLQEAFVRALRGTRHWRKDLPIVIFLRGAMRSIANGEKEKLAVEPILVAIPNQQDDEPDFDARNPAPNAEQELLAREEKKQLLGLFHDDEEAAIIVEGMMEGMEGQELRELTGLDEQKFSSKRRLVRRRINTAREKGTLL